MKNQFFRLLLLFTSLIPRFSIAHEPPDSGSVSLTISVFNDAGVSPSVMAQARDRAGFILRHSGISLIWLDCGTPANRPLDSGCSAISFPEHLSVRLVPTGSGGTQDIFGRSFQDAEGQGSYAVVYFELLAASESIQEIGTGDLLGSVIAHELGHLLLGRDSHSPSGLMSPSWQTSQLRLAARGRLFFTNQEQDRIRARYLAAGWKKASGGSIGPSGK
jgi:hypothetical protein